MSENLALNLTATASEHPDEIAVKLDDAAFNYGPVSYTHLTLPTICSV